MIGKFRLFAVITLLVLLSAHKSFGRELLVADRVTNSILAFDYDNPSSFRTLVSDPMHSTLSVPAAMTIGPGGDLFVASQGNGKVLRYNIETGAYLGEFANNIVGPAGLHYDSANSRMYVSALGAVTGFDMMSMQPIIEFPAGNNIHVYNNAGVPQAPVTGGHAGGRAGLAMDSSGNLYVSSFNIDGFDPGGGETGAVVKYNGPGFGTHSSLIAGDGNYLNGIPLVAGMNGLAIGNDGHLVAASMFGQSLFKISTDGVVQHPYITAPFDNMAPLSNSNWPTAFPSGVTIDPLTGDILVATLGDTNPMDGVYNGYSINGNVQRFDSNGNYLGIFIAGDDPLYTSMGFSVTSTLISPVPEPSTLLLAAIGMAGVVWYARQRCRLVAD